MFQSKEEGKRKKSKGDVDESKRVHIELDSSEPARALTLDVEEDEKRSRPLRRGIRKLGKLNRRTIMGMPGEDMTKLDKSKQRLYVGLISLSLGTSAKLWILVR